jgi:hypothetical protein
MARKRYNEEDILRLLREIEIHLNGGMDVVSAGWLHSHPNPSSEMRRIGVEVSPLDIAGLRPGNPHRHLHWDRKIAQPVGWTVYLSLDPYRQAIHRNV